MRKVINTYFLIVALLFALLPAPVAAQKLNGNTVASAPPTAVKLTLPVKEGSLRFAVIGDTGSGTPQQRDVGDMMAVYRAAFRLSLC